MSRVPVYLGNIFVRYARNTCTVQLRRAGFPCLPLTSLCDKINPTDKGKLVHDLCLHFSK